MLDLSIEKIELEINKKLVKLQKNFDLIHNKYSIPQKMSRMEYVWLVFSSNVYYKTKDILLITNGHKKEKQKIKSSIYIIFRSILEDYFYLKLITSNKPEIDLHLKALIVSSHKKTKKHFKSLLELHRRGKYFASNKDIDSITSIPGLERKIKEHERSINILEKENEKIKQFVEIYSNILKVCEEYDKTNNIEYIEEGKEHESLEWLYHFIFRFVSGSVHQILEMKESTLDMLWSGRSYQKDNEEVLSLILVMLDDVIKLFETKD